MAGNRKNQSAATWFGPALNALLLCTLIASSAIGYVWEKNEIYRLGRQISQNEAKLKQMRTDNKRLSDQLAMLRSPPLLDQRVRELNLGLAPAQPAQVWRLPERAAEPPEKNAAPRQLAARQAGAPLAQ